MNKLDQHITTQGQNWQNWQNWQKAKNPGTRPTIENFTLHPPRQTEFQPIPTEANGILNLQFKTP